MLGTMTTPANRPRYRTHLQIHYCLSKTHTHTRENSMYLKPLQLSSSPTLPSWVFVALRLARLHSPPSPPRVAAQEAVQSRQTTGSRINIAPPGLIMIRLLPWSRREMEVRPIWFQHQSPELLVSAAMHLDPGFTGFLSEFQKAQGSVQDDDKYVGGYF